MLHISAEVVWYSEGRMIMLFSMLKSHTEDYKPFSALEVEDYGLILHSTIPAENECSAIKNMEFFSMHIFS